MKTRVSPENKVAPALLARMDRELLVELLAAQTLDGKPDAVLVAVIGDCAREAGICPWCNMPLSICEHWLRDTVPNDELKRLPEGEEPEKLRLYSCRWCMNNDPLSPNGNLYHYQMVGDSSLHARHFSNSEYFRAVDPVRWRARQLMSIGWDMSLWCIKNSELEGECAQPNALIGRKPLEEGPFIP